MLCPGLLASCALLPLLGLCDSRERVDDGLSKGGGRSGEVCVPFSVLLTGIDVVSVAVPVGFGFVAGGIGRGKEVCIPFSVPLLVVSLVVVVMKDGGDGGLGSVDNTSESTKTLCTDGSGVKTECERELGHAVGLFAPKLSLKTNFNENTW